jgi:hypothetical protein
MTTPAIKAAIQAWGNITKNASAMLPLFAQGNSFVFNMPTHIANSPSMHVYLGIVNVQGTNKLMFFSIPSNLDNASTPNIHLHVVVSPAIWVYGGGRILAAEALARIDRWADNYQTWVPARAATAVGVFRAFDIPMEDYESSQSNLILGLKLEPTETLGQQADMIVKNVENSNIYYDDFVQAVPPYSPVAQASSFYLMS